nr:hypothetical protein [Intestinimonas timonensis]
MNRERLYRAIGDIDMKWVAESERPGKKKRARARWGALAACLCLLAAAPFLLQALNTFQLPLFSAGGGSGPPNITIDGRTFCVSSHVSVSAELPDGFALAGETAVADSGLGDCPYYLNPDIPEWVYVYHEVTTDGTLDALGHLKRTEPHDAYVRYVDQRLRGKDLLCCQGDLYISMWSADYYGEDPDVSEAYYNEMEERFGLRIEGDAPDSFVSVGIAAFSGDDTIPSGTLSSNQGQAEVYCSPNEPDVALVRTHWFTSTEEEGREIRHEGFDVFIRYDASFE